MEKLTGVVEKVTCYKQDSGYTVAQMLTESHGKVKIVGYMPPGIQGSSATVEGKWATHPKYGTQFKVSGFKTEKPNGEAGIVNYLSSGSLPGIGKVTAQRIYDSFGAQSLEIIEKQPDKLLEIKGITVPKLVKITEAFNQDKEMRSYIVKIQEYDISLNTAIKIYTTYKERCLTILKENPYALIRDVKGIGFQKADEIARRTGIAEDSPVRIQAAVMYCLGECFHTGNVYLMRNELINESQCILGFEKHDSVVEALGELIADGRIYVEEGSGGEERCYLPMLAHAENASARILASLLQATPEEINSEKLIGAYEATLHFELDKSQRDAIAQALSSQCAVITGGPGTGKTTIINGLCMSFAAQHLRIALAAPTGRAAKRMEETSGMEAKTVHRLLEYKYVKETNKLTFTRDETNPLDADVVIVDEASMLDLMLLFALIRAIKPGARLFFVGDVDQLPSVGPGNVLKDIIDSGVVTVVCLKQVHRQSEGSAICVNAERINNGETPYRKNGEFEFIKTESPEQTQEEVLRVVEKLREEGCDVMRDVQVLSPMKKGPAGTIALNEQLQSLLNPLLAGKREQAFGTMILREGDKVLQTKNAYDVGWKDLKTGNTGEGVFNGDLGIVTKLDPVHKLVEIIFNGDKQSIYAYTDIEDMLHSYAITVHKSQGAEFPFVVIPVMSGSPQFLNRRLLYTAVTRAKKRLILVGGGKSLGNMIRSTYTDNRNTALCQKLFEQFTGLEDVPF